MIREPYGFNPYNVTIDTSLAGEYSFVFSGDELESFKVEIAENNTSEVPKYISDYTHRPNTFNNDIVDFAILPSYLAAGSNGSVWRKYSLTLPEGETYPIGFTIIEVDGSIFYPEGSEEFVIIDGRLEFEGSAYVKDSNGATSIIFLDDTRKQLATYYNASVIKKQTTFYVPNYYNSFNESATSSWRLQTNGIQYRVLGLDEEEKDLIQYNYQLPLILEEVGDDYIAEANNIVYMLYDIASVNESGYNIEGYLKNTLGLDLIWRVRLWENNAIFSHQGKLIEKAQSPLQFKLESNHIALLNVAKGKLVDNKYIANLICGNEIRRVVDLNSDYAVIDRAFSEDTIYELGTEYILFTNYEAVNEKETRTNFASNLVKSATVLQDLGNDSKGRYFESGVLLPISENSIVKSSTTQFTLKSDNLRIEDIQNVLIPMDTTNFSINQTITFLNDKRIDIDGKPYIITAAINSNVIGYVKCTLNTPLVGKTKGTICEYVVYFDTMPDTTEYIGSVTKTTYEIPDYYYFAVTFNNINLYQVVEYEYWEYSDGDVRGFIHFNSAGETVEINTNRPICPYKLYSNFYISNWNFYQSRKNPVVKITNPPAQNWPSRLYTFKGSYIQDNQIPIKSHRWTIRDLGSLEDVVIYDTGDVYDSKLECTYDLFNEQGVYQVTLSVTNQENVIISTSINFNTLFQTIQIEAKGTATVNNNNQSIEIAWLNSIMSEPTVESNIIFNNDIVFNTESVYVEGKVTYDTLTGNDLTIDRDFTVAAGLTIDDQAKYYNSDLITIVPKHRGSPVILRKRGMELFMVVNGIEEKLFKTTNGTNFNLLANAWGQQQTILSDGEKTATDYLWYEYDESHTFKKDWYWTETLANTDTYYYEVIIGNEYSYLYQYAFSSSRLKDGIANDSHTLKIPFTNVLNNNLPFNLKVQIEDGNGNSTINVYENVEVTREQRVDGTSGDWLININKEDLVAGAKYNYAIYQTTPTEYFTEKYSITVADAYGKVILQGKINLLYLTVYQSKDATKQEDGRRYIGFGEKPQWTDQAFENGLLINWNTHNSLISQFVQSGDKAIIGYKVYRNKYAADGKTLISTTFIGQFSLEDTFDIDSMTIGLVDWAVPNKGCYDYTIIPLAETIYSRNAITTNQVKTDWYAWSFTSIGEIAENRYAPIEQWIFYLNLNSNGYQHNINKQYHQGFSPYPKVSIGLTDYMSTSLSCLLGDLESQAIQNTFTMWEYKNDNIEKIDAWRKFSNTNELVMVKDLKGHVFIGSLSDTQFSFQDIESEILTTVSFSITQIDDMKSYNIFTHQQNPTVMTSLS